MAPWVQPAWCRSASVCRRSRVCQRLSAGRDVTHDSEAALPSSHQPLLCYMIWSSLTPSQANRSSRSGSGSTRHGVSKIIVGRSSSE